MFQAAIEVNGATLIGFLKMEGWWNNEVKQAMEDKKACERIIVVEMRVKKSYYHIMLASYNACIERR